MATRRDLDEELEQARSAQRSMSQKMRSYTNGPNLKAPTSSGSNSPTPSSPTAGGREQPLVRREKSSGGKGQDDAAAARRSMGGINISQTPSTGTPGDDSHITGRAQKYKKVSAQDWGANDDLDGVQQKGVAITQITRLAVPMVRPKRAATPDGITSFHFSHEAITKTATERTSDSGSKTRPGSARDHSRYLEREAALARDEEGVVEKIENEAETEPKTESEMEADEIKKAFGNAEAGSVYLERQEALAVSTNGVAVLYSNIAETAAERRKFWSLVEEHEKVPGNDTMRVRMDANFDMWARVLADPACPEKVKDTLTKADPDLEVRIQTDDNQAMRRLMMRHGWTPPKREKRQETTEEREAREKSEDKQSGVIFEDARGGRIQYRIIGELPVEADHEGRVRILRGMAQEFEKRNLPYMAVMHAPDHTNNDNNWHFHLIYHDRPVDRFVNDPDHPSNAHLHPSPRDAPQTAAMKAEALQRIGTNEMDEHIGKWNFTVPLTKRMKQSGNIRIRYPFAREKDREPTRRPFVPMLRKRLADLTNEELERVGVQRRLDPRRYSEIGIDRTPDMHLGTKLSQHENLGIPTGIGQANERNQWNFIMGSIQKAQEKQEQDLRGDVSRMRNSVAATDPDEPEASVLERAIIAYEQNKRVANEHSIIARHLEEQYARAASRAKKVEETCKKHLDAIAHQRASNKVQFHRLDYLEKLNEAREHLAGLNGLMESELKQIVISQGIAGELNKEASKELESFEKLLKDVRDKKGLPELDAQNDNQRRPRAANDDEKARKVVGQANERLGSGDEGKGALTKKEMDAYVATLMKENVRLVVRNRVIVPKAEDPRFANIVTAPNYRTLMPRLTGIHQKQNETLSKLLELIDSDPKVIQIGRDDTGKAMPVLKTPDRALQTAFQYFGDEKRVIMAVDAAMASTGLRIDPEVQAPKPAPVTPEKSTKTVTPEPVNDTGRRIIAEVAARRLSAIEAIDISNGSARLTLNPVAAKRMSLDSEIVITPNEAQRLQTAMRYSERERARLAAYIAKAPKAVTITDEGIHLTSTAPKDMKTIAASHSNDPERVAQYKEQHNAALEKLAAKDQARDNVVAPTPAQADTRKVSGKQSDTSTLQEPKVAPVDIAPSKPAPDQVAASKMDTSGKDKAAAKDQGGFDLSAPVPPAPRETSTPVRTPEPTPVPAAANEQEKKKPRIRSLGSQSALADDPSTNPELRKKLEQDEKKAPAKQEDLFDIAAERERLQANKRGAGRDVRELQKGMHPSIDKWIEAQERGDEKLRHLAAEEIQNNTRARRIAKQLSDEEQGRIREDARLAREQAERRAEAEEKQGRDPQRDLYRDLNRKADD